MRRLTSCLLVTLVVGGVAGCASGEDGAAETAAPAASTSPVEVSVSVRNGKVSPPPRRVEVPQGADVRMTITLDVDDVVHVHGFEVEEPVEAGRPATVELVAGETGVFEVETHDSELTLLQLEVR